MQNVTPQNFIIGSSKQLIDKGLTINGVVADAMTFSVLAKHGLIAVVGKEEKPAGKRGKAGAVFSINAELLKAEFRA